MIAHPKKFTLGLVMLAAFAVVLAVIFMPVFPGGPGGKKENGLNYLDNLYNTISKGSAYYIPGAREEAKRVLGQEVKATLNYKEARQAEQTALLIRAAGGTATVDGTKLQITGGLGKILMACLDDSEDMYYNRGEKVAAKYGYPERAVLYNWHLTVGMLGKELTRQGNREGGDTGRQKFAQAKTAETVKTKAVEPAYNYFGIEPQHIGDEWGVVAFSLLFYVIYTVWYGYAIMFIFEGYGLNLEH